MTEALPAQAKIPSKRGELPMELKAYEQAWLDEFRQALKEKYPGMVEDVVIFDAEDAMSHVPHYAVNTVVILKKGGRDEIRDIDYMGYYLSAVSDTIPLIWVYTQAEWKRLQQEMRLPYKGSGISVWSTPR